MKTSIGLLSTILFFLSGTLVAQNNPVFGGGIDDGAGNQTFVLPAHNSIFEGGIDEGSAEMSYSIPSTNSVFEGGLEDGAAQALYAMPVHNLIFSGGLDDGHATGQFVHPVQSAIFGGGPDDGVSMQPYAQDANNSIFAGGADDGYVSFLALGLPTRLPPLLPVELLRFEAWRSGEEVMIEWMTANEVNLDYYLVEKSRDLTQTEEVGLQQGKGAPGETRVYAMSDLSPYQGLSFYRLRSVDVDGKVSYSSWAEVLFMPNTPFSLTAFPNPTTDLLHVKIRGDSQAHYSLELCDLAGRRVQGPIDVYPETDHTLNLQGLPQGIYVLWVIEQQEGLRHALKVQKTAN